MLFLSGPTHDDVTLTALAAALGLPLEPHPHMLRLIKQGHFVKKKPTNTEEQQQEVSANPPAGAVAPVPAAAAADADAVVNLEDFSDAQKAMATFPKGSWLRMPSPVKPGDKPWPVLQVLCKCDQKQLTRCASSSFSFFLYLFLSSPQLFKPCF